MVEDNASNSALKRIIVTKGCDMPGLGKVKGYFYAKQEEPRLRIFIDKMPSQNQNW